MTDPLQSLIDDGTITQAQHDAVMEALNMRGSFGFNKRANSAPKQDKL